HGLCLPREERDRLVQLAPETLGGVFAGVLDLLRELLCQSVGEAVRGPLDDPLQLIELAPLGIREPGLDALDRLGLLDPYALAKLPLAFPQALRDLVQRATPVGL